MAWSRKLLPKMCEGYLCRGACSGRGQDGLGTGADGSKLSFAWQSQHLGKPRYRCRGRCNIFARSSTNFVAGGGFSQCWHGRIANLIGADVQGAARRLRGRRRTFARSGNYRFRGRPNAFARSRKISWWAQYFRKVRYRVHGRHSTFARPGTDFVALSILSQGQVQISWQAQHFRKARCRLWRARYFRKVKVSFAWQAQVRYRFRGRRNTFARSSKISCRTDTPKHIDNHTGEHAEHRTFPQTSSPRGSVAGSGAESHGKRSVCSVQAWIRCKRLGRQEKLSSFRTRAVRPQGCSICLKRSAAGMLWELKPATVQFCKSRLL